MEDARSPIEKKLPLGSVTAARGIMKFSFVAKQLLFEVSRSLKEEHLPSLKLDPYTFLLCYFYCQEMDLWFDSTQKLAHEVENLKDHRRRPTTHHTTDVDLLVPLHTQYWISRTFTIQFETLKQGKPRIGMGLTLTPC